MAVFWGEETNPPSRIRYGRKEHFWRHRPRPFRKELLFGSKHAAEARGKEKVTLHTSGCSPAEPESNLSNGRQLHTTNDVPTIDNDTPGACFEENLFNFDSVWVCNVYSLSNPFVDSTSIVVDSGSSSSVRSTEVVQKANPSLLSTHDRGSRKFRFGDIRSFGRVGTILMRGKLPVLRLGKKVMREVAVQLDELDAGIPILLSRRTLSLVGAVINFTNCPLTLENGDLAQLEEKSSGHMSLPLNILSIQSNEGTP